MKKIFTLTLVSIAAIFSLSSCTKSDVISNETDVVGTWAVTGIRSNIANDWNGDGYPEMDIYGSYTPCQRDIMLAFDRYGGGQGRQGCNSYWEALSWQLTNGNRTLRIDLTDDIIQLDNLRVGYNTIQGDDYVYSNGRDYVVTYTLERR